MPEAETSLLRAELEGCREQLRRVARAQERFISQVSHDINTPIAVLLSESQTLDQSSLSGEARGFVASVQDEMRRLRQVVADLVLLSDIRAGRKITRPVEVDLNEAVLDAVSGASVLARAHAISLECRLAEGDPAPVVTGDPGLLTTMVANLVGDCIRATPPGGSISVCVEARDGAEGAGGAAMGRVVLADRGPHLTQDIQHSRWEDDTCKRVRGTTVGLSVAQAVAELHGGRLSSRNLPEGGCEFTVHLPLTVGGD